MKVINWELCKKSKFDNTTKWYKHNSHSVQENEMHKILWDFEIQTHHINPSRRSDLVLINKSAYLLYIIFCHSSKLHSKNIEKEKKDEYLKLTKN